MDRYPSSSNKRKWFSTAASSSLPFSRLNCFYIFAVSLFRVNNIV